MEQRRRAVDLYFSEGMTPGRVIDCFDGMVVSWTLSRSPGAAMADGMLLDAIATLGDGERPVIHSDRPPNPGLSATFSTGPISQQLKR